MNFQSICHYYRRIESDLLVVSLRMPVSEFSKVSFIVLVLDWLFILLLESGDIMLVLSVVVFESALLLQATVVIAAMTNTEKNKRFIILSLMINYFP